MSNNVTQMNPQAQVESAVNELVENAQVAFKAYQNFTQEQVDAVCEAMVSAALAHAKD